MAMANAVEGRYPFLDYRVVEYAARIPPRFKLNGLTEKFVLKKLAGTRPQGVDRPAQASLPGTYQRVFFQRQAPRVCRRNAVGNLYKEGGLLRRRQGRKACGQMRTACRAAAQRARKHGSGGNIVDAVAASVVHRGISLRLLSPTARSKGLCVSGGFVCAAC